MKQIVTTFFVWVVISAGLYGDCSLDHLSIGCNQDGIVGTDDDAKLFIDSSQKYRHSDPANPNGNTWLNWYYPLYPSVVYSPYYIGEPGFQEITDDPCKALQGTPNADYRIIIECLDIADGFCAVKINDFNINQPGDSFNLSQYAEAHVHVNYIGQDRDTLKWITFYAYDELADPGATPDDPNGYFPSEPFTIVFAQEPLPGDIAVDGIVEINDLVKFSSHWTKGLAERKNDFYERDDCNRDGYVDMIDYAMLADNWLKIFE